MGTRNFSHEFFFSGNFIEARCRLIDFDYVHRSARQPVGLPLWSIHSMRFSLSSWDGTVNCRARFYSYRLEIFQRFWTWTWRHCLWWLVPRCCCCWSCCRCRCCKCSCYWCWHCHSSSISYCSFGFWSFPAAHFELIRANVSDCLGHPRRVVPGSLIVLQKPVERSWTSKLVNRPHK